VAGPSYPQPNRAPHSSTSSPPGGPEAPATDAPETTTAASAGAEGFTIEFTEYEARALRNTGELLLSGLEARGCDLNEAELPDGTRGPSPLMTACMKLELVLTLAGREI
jgi:hypothetical protein